MLSNITFKKDELLNSDLFDNATNTLTLKDVTNDAVYITFKDYMPENLIVNVVNSNVTLIETYVGNVNSSHYTINVDSNSNLNRLSILVETTSTTIIDRDVNNKGYYQSMQIDLTSCNIESVENINMIEENANALIIDGIYATDHSNKKYQTNLNHICMSCQSKAQIFAINNDYAHVSINTDAYIKQGAHQTKTTQEGRIINLSDTCSGIVFPNLHIDENDVEASHSCSVGSVNNDHLYYLQTRGFSKEQATNILIRGYFNPLLKNIDDENIKESLIKVLDQRIG